MESVHFSSNRENGRRNARSISLEPVTSQSENSHLSRTNARKSRFTDAFLDAKDRIDRGIEDEANNSQDDFDKSCYRFQRIVIGSESLDSPTGIEVSAVPNPDPNRPNRLLAVEVIRIEENGRVGQDGRMRVGDQIVEINGLPCSKISFARARLRLRELATIAEPSIAFQRQIIVDKKSSEPGPSISVKPLSSALQQNNTSRIGSTKSFAIEKSREGFGFSFAGRLNALGEHLFYVKTVKQGGPCANILSIGDRILKIDERDLSGMQQTEVTALLKTKSIQETIELLVSRNISESEEELNPPAEDTSTSSLRSNSIEDGLREQITGFLPAVELIRLEIPLNDSPSAGLGVSLKAQRTYSDGVAVDSGLYIRSILHGSAAFKDGRLRVNDRLAGVENVNLLMHNLNGEALDAFMRSLSLMPSSATSICIFVTRQKTDLPSEEKPKTEFVINRPILSSSIARESSQEGELPVTLTCYGSDSDISQISVVDPNTFVRDTVIRKSISEKRPFGTHNDPSHLQTYQRIVHHRQTSAPAIGHRVLANGQNRKFNNNLAPLANHQLSANYLKSRRSSLCNFGGEHQQSFQKRLQLANAENQAELTTARKRRPMTAYGDVLANDLPAPKIDDASPKLSQKLGVSTTAKKPSKLAEFFFGSGRKNKQQTSLANDQAKENLISGGDGCDGSSGSGDASPKRRSISVGASPVPPRAHPKPSVANDAKLSQNGHHSDEVSVQNAPGHIPTSFSQPEFLHQQGVKPNERREPLANLPQQPLAQLGNLVGGDKRERRKSIGNGLLKFFKGSSREHSKGRSPTEWFVKIGDEMEQERRHFPSPPHPAHFHPPKSSPQFERRPPPPPYYYCVSGGEPPPLLRQHFFHQRGFSANEQTSRRMDKCKWGCAGPALVPSSSSSSTSTNYPYNHNTCCSTNPSTVYHPSYSGQMGAYDDDQFMVDEESTNWSRLPSSSGTSNSATPATIPQSPAMADSSIHCSSAGPSRHNRYIQHIYCPPPHLPAESLRRQRHNHADGHRLGNTAKTISSNFTREYNNGNNNPLTTTARSTHGSLRPNNSSNFPADKTRESQRESKSAVGQQPVSQPHRQVRETLLPRCNAHQNNADPDYTIANKAPSPPPLREWHPVRGLRRSEDGPSTMDSSNIPSHSQRPSADSRRRDQVDDNNRSSLYITNRWDMSDIEVHANTLPRSPPPKFQPASMRRHRHSKQLKRRSVPSAVFYDDCEPPVHC